MSRVDLLSRMVARVRALPPGRQDLAAVAFVVAAGVFDVGWYVRDASLETAVLGFAAVGVVAVAIGIRRTRPLAAVVLGFGMMVVLGQDALLDETNVPFFALLVLPYSVARHTDGRDLYAGMALIVVLLSAGMLTDTWDDTVADFLFSLALVISAPAIAGRLLRNRAALAHALAEKAARLERERTVAAGRAVEDERTRIAGELHDVVSHALSAMVVGAGGARLLAGRDPEKAAMAFAQVEETGREALSELRRLLGVLRREDEELALAPQPSLAHLGDLIRRTERSGLPVELRTDGEPPAAVPVGVDLTAFRLVQAALAAARDDGRAGRATVDVRYLPGRVEVAVLDDGGTSGERRLLGMRERVLLYGGEVHAGPRQRGGHAVRANLPLEVPA